LRINKTIRKRDHITVHISAGVKSKIITALNVETKKGRDNIIFREHVDKTARNFKIREWSGDGMYWARNFKIREWSGDGMYWAKDNCKKISEIGAKPYFNCKKSWNGKQSGVPSWKKMNQESKDNPKEYGKHYHKRSNVETANQMKKMLHGDKVYSEFRSARINEESFRWINHNINVLNRAKYEWKIIPKGVV